MDVNTAHLVDHLLAVMHRQSGQSDQRRRVLYRLRAHPRQHLCAGTGRLRQLGYGIISPVNSTGPVPHCPVRYSGVKLPFKLVREWLEQLDHTVPHRMVDTSATAAAAAHGRAGGDSSIGGASAHTHKPPHAADILYR